MPMEHESSARPPSMAVGQALLLLLLVAILGVIWFAIFRRGGPYLVAILATFGAVQAARTILR